MGGRSGQSINNVGSGATSNVSINAPNLSKELQDYSLTVAKRYGLTGNIEIEVNKKIGFGGYVSMDIVQGKGIDTKIFMNSNKMFINTGGVGDFNVSNREIIRHELKHIQQAQQQRLVIQYDQTMKKPILKVYFDGKPVISLTKFKELNKFKKKTDYEDYKKLPWEAEAYATANDD